MTKKWEDPERINEILDLVERVWRLNPQMRLGQIVSMAFIMVGKEGKDIYHGGDDKLIEGLVLMLRLAQEKSQAKD